MKPSIFHEIDVILFVGVLENTGGDCMVRGRTFSEELEGDNGKHGIEDSATGIARFASTELVELSVLASFLDYCPHKPDLQLQGFLPQ